MMLVRMTLKSIWLKPLKEMPVGELRLKPEATPQAIESSKPTGVLAQSRRSSLRL
jgi:hypothetical protein